MSSYGMSTFIWGPLFWNLLTDMAIRMDGASHSHSSLTGVKYSAIWYALRDILPCKYCRQSYRKFVNEDPPTKSYIKWLWTLRNKVNLKLEKPLFEWDKFQRRCHVYSSFSSLDMWWDIHFIMALNYDPVKKRKAYAQWFKLIPLMTSVLPYPTFDKLIPKSALASKIALLRWFTDEYNHQHKTTLTMEMVVRKYSHAIAHRTPEELASLCGPLIVKCQRMDKKIKM